MEAYKLVHEEQDCHCGHSYYDHIGWREGSNDPRVSCRIVRCGCECYTENTTPNYLAFDSQVAYGYTSQYSGNRTSIPQDVKSILHRSAKAILPPNWYYEIRLSLTSRSISWIYLPAMVHPSYFHWPPDLDPPEVNLADGYLTIGGYYT